VGSFLGEYQAGGLMIVLGLEDGGKFPAGNFTGTGMHGGRIFIRCKEEPTNLPRQVAASLANQEDLDSIAPFLNEYAADFGLDADEVLKMPFYVLLPNAKNPYQTLYIEN
jgi:glutamate synthase domain-containing protein 3